MTELVITSSVLILVLILLRHLFKGKISPGIQYALWALVLVRLLVPVSPLESPVSIMNAFKTAAVADEEQAPISTPSPLPAPSLIYEDTETVLLPDDAFQAGAAGATNVHHGTFDWAKLLRFMWYAGIGIVGLCLLLSNLIFGRRLVETRKKYQAGNCKLPVYVAEGLPSTCLFGVFRPAIYITPDVAEDKTKLRYVLAHEQTHYRHGDHIWSALRSLCLAIHWYNPLVWLAAVLSRRDAELACDESTIKNIGEANRMEYGRTLIGLTCEKRKTTDLLCCATTMIDGKNGIRERITFIAKKPKMLVPAFVAVLLAVLIAVGCTFTGAKNDAKIVPLTAEEVKQYNQIFEPFLFDSDQQDNLKVGKINPLSHFLLSYYAKPENLNLADFLRYYPSDENVTNEVEFEALKAEKNWPFGADATLNDMPVPIHKFSAITINKVLKKYMDITLDDLSDVGRDELIYLKEYDAYYNFTSDFAAASFNCTSGETQGDIIRLYSENAVLTLKKHGDGFFFMSHQLLEKGVDGNSNTNRIGLVMDSISVPHDVLSAAKAQVEGYFTSACADHPDYEYANWRIESLEWAYTYDNLDGLALDIYRINYEFFSKTPEKILLAGGMYVTDDGWVCPTYPHCTYLIFNADDGFFFRAIMRNDCYPGDEMFTSALSNLRLSETALKAAGVGEAIASVDIDRDGNNEKFYLDTFQMTEHGLDRVALRVYNDRGYGIWSENAYLAHAGWNSLFLCELDGEPYLLRYSPAMFQGYCDYTYTLFTLEGGAEKVYQTNTLEFDINGTKALDAPGMVAFADEVNALLEKSTLLLSSKDGTFTPGPASPLPFLETYSWLDDSSGLYAAGDNLAVRLQKYSDYATLNRKGSFKPKTEQHS
jgi:beta-lactamase regulating signal transducer with metallopeptidase domain